jgi:hypothetical protein
MSRVIIVVSSVTERHATGAVVRLDAPDLRQVSHTRARGVNKKIERSCPAAAGGGHG